jgi:hypothetical protein
LHQEGRLQSVVEMTESLRLDVSSNTRKIDRLCKRAIADRTERDGMVTTIAQQGVTITELGGTVDNLKGCAIADRIERDGMVTTIAQQGVTITELGGTVDNLKGCAIADRIERDGMVTTIAHQGVKIENLKGCAIADRIERDGMVTTIAQHGVTIENLVTDSKKNSDLIVLFDLICLYRFYFVLPKILASKNHANWGGLCEAITKATDAHEDGDMTDDDYNTLRDEWNTYSPAVDIFTLRKWSTARHDVAHSDIRSTRDQQIFIAASNLQIFADSHMNDLRVLLVASLNTLSVGEVKRNK